MKILVDMNLSPSWCAVLEGLGHEARHWMNTGVHSAPDSEVMGWARENGYILFTHDLDFGAILAATSANAPSVIQLRTQDPTPQSCSGIVQRALQQSKEALMAGALVSVDSDRARIHALPLR